MATDNTRAIKKIDYAHILTLTTSATVNACYPVAFSGDGTVANAGTTDDTIIGVALGDVGVTYTTGKPVQVGLLGPVYKTLVGTGGCTRGKKQIMAANGITDAPAHDSSGATDGIIVGIALESGLVGDYIGMMLTLGNRGSA